jgi:hypothetical protein
MGFGGFAATLPMGSWSAPLGLTARSALERNDMDDDLLGDEDHVGPVDPEVAILMLAEFKKAAIARRIDEFGLPEGNSTYVDNNAELCAGILDWLLNNDFEGFVK